MNPSFFRCIAYIAILSGLWLSACSPGSGTEQATQGKLQLVLADSFFVKEIGALELADQHPVTGHYLIINQSKNDILITDAKGNILNKIGLRNPEVFQPYANQVPYKLAFYGEKQLAFICTNGLFITDYEGKVSYHYEEKIILKQNDMGNMSLFSLKDNNKEYLLAILKLDKPNPKITPAEVISKEYIQNYRALSVYSLTEDSSWVTLPLEADSQLITAGYYYEDRRALLSVDSLQKKLYLFFNPEQMLYEYSFTGGEARFINRYPIALEHFKRRHDVRFGEINREGLRKALFTNSTVFNMLSQGDSCLVAYSAGITNEEYMEHVNATGNLQAFLKDNYKTYLSLHVKGKRVGSDCLLPRYVLSLSLWGNDGMVYFQTNRDMVEHIEGTMFYKHKLQLAI